MQNSRPGAILFVGSGSIAASELSSYVQSATPARVEVDAVGVDGATLGQLWADPAARGALTRRRWDVVVLQEHHTFGRTFRDGEAVSGTTPPQHLFWPAARLWSDAARAAGGQPAVVIAPAMRDEPLKQDLFTAAAVAAGREARASILPVGLAWQRLRADRPDVPLHGADGAAAAPAGVHLAALTIAEAMFGSSRRPPGDAGRTLQQAASAVARAVQRGSLAQLAPPVLDTPTLGEPRLGISRADYDGEWREVLTLYPPDRVKGRQLMTVLVRGDMVAVLVQGAEGRQQWPVRDLKYERGRLTFTAGAGMPIPGPVQFTLLRTDRGLDAAVEQAAVEHGLFLTTRWNVY